MKNSGALCLLSLFIGLAGPGKAGELVIPHIADGGGWKSTIVLTNPSAETAQVSLSFRRAASQGSEAWTPAFEGGAAVSHSLPGGAAVFMRTVGAGAETAVGWASVQSTTPIEAYVIFTSAAQQEATAPAMSATKRVLIPFDNTGGFVTSMALVNPTSSSQRVTVGIRTAGGLVTSAELGELPFGGHTAFEIPTRLPATAGQQGMLEFVSSAGVLAGIGLRFNPAGAFTAVPAYHRTGEAIINGPRLGALNLSTTTVQPGNSIQGTITLSAPAPVGGATITLQSSSPAASVPATLQIPAGSTTGSFPISVSAGSASQQVTITALFGGVTAQSTLSVVAIQIGLNSLTLAANTISQGGTVLGTVQLSGPAPTGGVVVSLQSSSLAATVPATVVVPAGSTTANFTVTGGPASTPQQATITAQYAGGTAQATLTVNPISVRISSIVLAASSVTSGVVVSATVTLSGPAPAGGAVVTLASSSPAAVVPATVIIPAGSSSALFQVATAVVSSIQQAVISAAYGGSTVQAMLGITVEVSVRLKSLRITPGVIHSGGATQGEVMLERTAPPGGVVIQLASDPTVSVPASVTIPEGATYTTFTVMAGAVGSTQRATITAGYQGATVQAELGILATATSISGLVAYSTSIQGGEAAVVTVILNGPAPEGGAALTLWANSTWVVVPGAVVVPSGTPTVEFFVSALGGGSPRSVTIWAQYGNSTAQLNFTVGEPGLTLNSIKLPTNSIKAGDRLRGVAALNGRAPAEGAQVTLSSSSGAITAPPTIVVPAGRTSIEFEYSAAADTSSSQNVTITAAYQGKTVQASTLVAPLQQGSAIPIANMSADSLQFDPAGFLPGKLSLHCSREPSQMEMSCALFFNTAPLGFNLRIRLISKDGGATYVADSLMPSSAVENFSIAYMGTYYYHTITSMDLQFTHAPRMGSSNPADRDITGTLRIAGQFNPGGPEVVLSGAVTGSAFLQ